MKWTVTLSTFCVCGALLAGCEAEVEQTETRRVSHEDLPFTLEMRTDFTEESINRGDTRGDVIVGYGISKLDVIAVRRVGGQDLPEGPVEHEVQGQTVTSELFPVADGYAIECQYREDREETVRSACRDVVDSVRMDTES